MHQGKCETGHLSSNNHYDIKAALDTKIVGATILNMKKCQTGSRQQLANPRSSAL